MENRLLFYSKDYNDMKRFSSYCYQINLALECEPKNILELGKGNGVFTNFFKELLGVGNVVSVDHNPDLEPDVVNDIREIKCPNPAWDLVTAFEVLEHIPYTDFVKLLPELCNATKKHVIISLPIHQNYFGEKKGMVSACHEWEINDEHRLTDVRAELEKYFHILNEINPKENKYHYFFVLQKRELNEI